MPSNAAQLQEAAAESGFAGLLWAEPQCDQSSLEVPTQGRNHLLLEGFSSGECLPGMKSLG